MPIGTVTGFGNTAGTASNTAGSCTLPTITADGVAYLLVGTNVATTLSTPPAGWTLVDGPRDNSAGTQRAWLYSRAVTAADSGAGVSVTFAASSRWSLGGFVVPGGDGLGVVDFWADDTVDSTLSVNAITPTADDAYRAILVQPRSNSAAYTVAPPAGWTELFEGIAGTAARWGVYAAGVQLVGQAGVEQAATSGSYSGAFARNIGWQFTVRPTPSATPKSGSASGTLAWVGTASGSTTRRGSAAGSLAFVGTASGATARRGSASGALAWSGAASGATQRHGSASGSLSWAGTATGRTERRGTASGALAWAGTASGEAPSVEQRDGSASGSLAWAGTATGRTTRSGSGAGTLAWVGTATGKRLTSGAAASELVWSGTASGHTDRSGSAFGDLAWAGTASGSNRERRDLSGTATLLADRARASITHTDRARAVLSRDRALATLVEED